MSSLSEITATFTDLVKAVQAYEQAAFDGLNATATTEWFSPPAGNDPLELRDPDSIAKAFDRQEVHDLMLKILHQETAATDDGPADALQPANVQPTAMQGTVMDLAVIQSQLEFIQAVERCYFNATMGYCRAAAHASARHEGHAVAGGVLDRGVAAYVSNLKRAASARGQDGNG